MPTDRVTCVSLPSAMNSRDRITQKPFGLQSPNSTPTSRLKSSVVVPDMKSIATSVLLHIAIEYFRLRKSDVARKEGVFKPITLRTSAAFFDLSDMAVASRLTTPICGHLVKSSNQLSTDPMSNRSSSTRTKYAKKTYFGFVPSLTVCCGKSAQLSDSFQSRMITSSIPHV